MRTILLSCLVAASELGSQAETLIAYEFTRVHIGCDYDVQARMDVNNDAWARIDNNMVRFEQLQSKLHKAVINTENMKF